VVHLKGSTVTVSLLFATLARRLISVADKGFRGIKNVLTLEG
jgi:hypothetical protein